MTLFRDYPVAWAFTLNEKESSTYFHNVGEKRKVVV